MKPLIGITCDFAAGERPPFSGQEPTLYLRTRYVRAVEANGGVPVLLPIVGSRPSIDRLLDQIDGLLITGSGPDIDPALYGEEPRFAFQIMRPERAAFEIALTRRALRKGVPILGICGGMQLLNVASGGTLVQDLGREIHSCLPHRRDGEGQELAHSVTVEPGSRLFRILNRRKLKTNSFHHQAVKEIGEGFRICARAADGVIEAIELNGAPFVVGVQWHPEYLFSRRPDARRIFLGFLRAARQRRRRLDSPARLRRH